TRRTSTFCAIVPPEVRCYRQSKITCDHLQPALGKMRVFPWPRPRVKSRTGEGRLSWPFGNQLDGNRTQPHKGTYPITGRASLPRGACPPARRGPSHGAVCKTDGD